MKTIMIQGTSSNTGKTIFTAGLCRLLYLSGYKVFPFKPQNISLNSYITDAGEEIGYSQFIQSYASGIKASHYMNPVLIKILSNCTQFIVNGKVKHTGSFSDYKKMLPTLKKAIKNSLKKIEDLYDIVVIEGAGSPVEINRSSTDISNMWTAKLYNTPILLIANMELGGAFASIAGTLELLDDDSRKLIKGYIFNKYTGDSNLLDKGTKKLTEKYGKEYLGMLPYIQNIGIPDEDYGSYNYSNENKNPNMTITEFNLDESLNRISFEIEKGIGLNKILNFFPV